MAVEKFITGKRDACKHEGRRSTVRRIAAAEEQLKNYFEMAEGIEYPIFPQITQQDAIERRINPLTKEY